MTRMNRFSWNIKSVKGGCVPGESAGGCLNFIDTFDLNPQYRFTVETPDDSDTGNECTVIISLMQRDRRSLRDEGLDSLPIGFQVFSLFPDPADFPKTLKKNFFRRRMAVGGTTTYNTLREVTARCTLPPGTYCIVPSTFDPEEAAEFYLRIFTHSTVDSDF
jgi:calpain